MKDLKEYRNRLDEIDRCMVNLFIERMKISKEIGDYKRRNNLPVLDKKREEEKLLAVNELVHETELKEEARNFYIYLMDRSKKIQK